MPSGAASLRRVQGDGRPVEEDLAGVVGLRAGETLDQGRLAGAVVADERGDLAGVDLQVTPLSTSTGPKLLRMSCSSMSGVSTAYSLVQLSAARRHEVGGHASSDLDAHGHHDRTRLLGAPAGLLRCPPRRTRLDLVGADLGDLGVAVVEHDLMFSAVTTIGVCAMNGVPSSALSGTVGLLAVEQLHGQVDRGLRPRAGTACRPWRSACRAGRSAARRAGVLTADRDRHAVLVQDRDDAGRVDVVGGPDGVDVALRAV